MYILTLDSTLLMSSMYNISETVQVIEYAEYWEDMQIQTKEIEQIYINELIDELKKYVTIHDNMWILHGSFLQGDERFNIESCGKQHSSIAALACLDFFLIRSKYLDYK